MWVDNFENLSNSITNFQHCRVVQTFEICSKFHKLYTITSGKQSNSCRLSTKRRCMEYTTSDIVEPAKVFELYLLDFNSGWNCVIIRLPVRQINSFSSVKWNFVELQYISCTDNARTHTIIHLIWLEAKNKKKPKPKSADSLPVCLSVACVICIDIPMWTLAQSCCHCRN